MGVSYQYLDGSTPVKKRKQVVEDFITKGTIEEKIVALHQTKRDLADSLLDGSNIASKLSTDDLLNLLRDQ